MLAILFLSLLATVPELPTPDGWRIVKDSKGVCQIAVPPDWDALFDNAGAAVLHDASNAIAVVTSQPAQAFQPLPENLQKLMGIRKDRLFENSAKRIFYQDRISQRPEDPNAYSVSVPGKTGTCSAHVMAVPGVPEETAKKIALSLGPVQP